MKILEYTFYALILVGLVSCGASSDKNDKETIIEQSSIADEGVSVESAESIRLINIVYEKFVFAIDVTIQRTYRERRWEIKVNR